MIFECDERKNRTNIRKHGFDLAGAEAMFRGMLLTDPDLREDYGEKRWVGLGSIRGRIAHVVFSEISPERTRVISLRRATSRERKLYENAIQDRLETGRCDAR